MVVTVGVSVVSEAIVIKGYTASNIHLLYEDRVGRVEHYSIPFAKFFGLFSDTSNPRLENMVPINISGFSAERKLGLKRLKLGNRRLGANAQGSWLVVPRKFKTHLLWKRPDVVCDWYYLPRGDRRPLFMANSKRTPGKVPRLFFSELMDVLESPRFNLSKNGVVTQHLKRARKSKIIDPDELSTDPWRRVLDPHSFAGVNREFLQVVGVPKMFVEIKDLASKNKFYRLTWDEFLKGAVTWTEYQERRDAVYFSVTLDLLKKLHIEDKAHLFEKDLKSIPAHFFDTHNLDLQGETVYLELVGSKEAHMQVKVLILDRKGGRGRHITNPSNGKDVFDLALKDFLEYLIVAHPIIVGRRLIKLLGIDKKRSLARDQVVSLARDSKAKKRLYNEIREDVVLDAVIADPFGVEHNQVRCYGKVSLPDSFSPHTYLEVSALVAGEEKYYRLPINEFGLDAVRRKIVVPFTNKFGALIEKNPGRGVVFRKDVAGESFPRKLGSNLSSIWVCIAEDGRPRIFIAQDKGTQKLFREVHPGALDSGFIFNFSGQAHSSLLGAFDAVGELNLVRNQNPGFLFLYADISDPRFRAANFFSLPRISGFEVERNMMVAFGADYQDVQKSLLNTHGRHVDLEELQLQLFPQGFNATQFEIRRIQGTFGEASVAGLLGVRKELEPIFAKLNQFAIAILDERETILFSPRLRPKYFGGLVKYPESKANKVKAAFGNSLFSNDIFKAGKKVKSNGLKVSAGKVPDKALAVFGDSIFAKTVFLRNAVIDTANLLVDGVKGSITKEVDFFKDLMTRISWLSKSSSKFRNKAPKAIRDKIVEVESLMGPFVRSIMVNADNYSLDDASENEAIALVHSIKELLISTKKENSRIIAETDGLKGPASRKVPYLPMEEKDGKMRYSDRGKNSGIFVPAYTEESFAKLYFGANDRVEFAELWHRLLFGYYMVRMTFINSKKRRYGLSEIELGQYRVLKETYNFHHLES
ncbi:hypothetical protein HOC01_06400 [archaeon]|jgi:hypothetical protein|nr:hypothetical protein [archaeon]MBT6697529.1 hypothetical protein [archaeon]